MLYAYEMIFDRYVGKSSEDQITKKDVKFLKGNIVVGLEAVKVIRRRRENVCR